MMLKQIEKSQSLITVSVLVLNCTLALLLKPTQVAYIEKKEGENRVKIEHCLPPFVSEGVKLNNSVTRRYIC